jgi:membrane-associated protein
VTGHALNPLDATSLINTFGVVGVLVIIFIECAVIVGFFLPGDSLLFVAGVAASGATTTLKVHLNFAVLLIGTPLVAIIGSQIAHFTGAKFGRKLFDKPDSRFFKRKYVDRAEVYFNKYGPAKTVVISRFIVGVRTFANPLAGMLEMPAKKFFLWNTISAIGWTELVLLLGYFTGDHIKGNIDTWILPIAALIAVISLLPIFFEVMKARRERRAGGGDPLVASATADGVQRSGGRELAGRHRRNAD